MQIVLEFDPHQNGAEELIFLFRDYFCKAFYMVTWQKDWQEAETEEEYSTFCIVEEESEPG